MASEYELEADAREIGKGWLFDRFRGWAEEYEVPIGELVRERNKLRAERDEAREKWEKSAYCDLYNENHKLKALCGEARLRLLKLDDVFDKGDLRERLRAARGE